MARKIWFGNTTHAQWVPCPRAGMTRLKEGYSEEIAFENGGAWIERSKAWHNVYPMEFPVADAHEYEGIEAFNRFASGEYGDGFLYWVDPMYSNTNLFAPNWASPGLIESGWKNWGGDTPTFSDTASNGYGYPLRTATWTLESDANVFQGVAHTFIIPPGYTLHLGATGSVTGTAQIVAQDSSDAFTAITPVAATVSPTFPVAFSGDTYRYARVGIRRTSTASSTVSLTALRAQILPSGSTPVASRHIPGNGSMGLSFRGTALPETYEMAQRSLVGLSTELIEVEPWQ